VIEEGAYVGSGCELVAPIVIGKDATIGAGSTVTKDVPAGELTIARARQRSVPGWVAPEKRNPAR
jgi:bifunctional UDP-N-acetylglucosamine pyrophosphorylase/glucosamine-1-phosphate N-acetyltransferase